jgi:hypothetical protein
LRITGLLAWLKSELPKVVQSATEQALLRILQNSPVASGKNINEPDWLSLVQNVNNQMTASLVGQKTFKRISN